MIFLISIAFLSVINAIPQNLGLTIVKVPLSRESIPFPPLLHIAGIVEKQLLNFKIQNIVLPVFDKHYQQVLPTTTQTLITENSDGWQENKDGKLLPIWNPQEFDKDYLDLLNEDQKNLIESSSRISYEGQLRIGSLENLVSVEFGLNTDNNYLLSPECQNCSKGDQKTYFKCDSSNECEIIEKNVQFKDFVGDKCKTLLYFKKYEIIEDAPVQMEFYSIKQSNIEFKAVGKISLKTSSKLPDEFIEKKLINEKVFGLHYQSDLVNEDKSFLILGGIEEHYRQDDFTFIPAKIKNYAFTFSIDGMIAQITQDKLKTIYGLQKYDVVLDESSIFLKLPLAVLQTLKDTLGQLDIHCYIDREMASGVLVCDKESNQLPIITFVVQGKEISILPSIYGGVCKTIKDVKLCFTKFSVSINDQIVFGEPLFVNYFVLFDIDNNRLGFSRPKTQQIVDWSIFDNAIAFLLLLIVSGGLILTGIICIRVNSRSREVPFQNFNDENSNHKSRKPVTIELKK